MASSSFSKDQPVENYSNAPTTVTRTVKTTWTMEDFATKVTLTDEETQKAKLATDRQGNLRLNQEYRNKTTETVMGKREGRVKKVTHQAVSKGSNVFDSEEEAESGIIEVLGPTSEVEDDDEYEKMSHQFMPSDDDDDPCNNDSHDDDDDDSCNNDSGDDDESCYNESDDDDDYCNNESDDDDDSCNNESDDDDDSYNNDSDDDDDY